MIQAHTSKPNETVDASAAPAGDLRRYIGRTAAPGQPLSVRLPGSVEVARGTWTKVRPSSLGARFAGKVPEWIPGIGGKEFQVRLAFEYLDTGKGRVTVSGTVSGSSEGNIEFGDTEMKMVDLHFAPPLNTVTSIALEPWNQTETRVSLWHVPGLRFWFAIWLAPLDDDGVSHGDYPSPKLPAGDAP